MRLISIHDGHNASVALMENGEIKFAIQEEKLTRMKNSGGFPYLALNELLKKCNLKIDEIDKFIFTGFKGGKMPKNSRQYFLKKYYNFFERRESFGKKINKFLNKTIKFFLPKKLLERRREKRNIKERRERIKPLLKFGIPQEKIAFVEHHLCHASSAAYGWGEKEKFVVVTLDSAGDRIAGSVNIFKNGEIERLSEIKIEDSPARLYSLITFYLGMIPMEHEYKLMGLSSYAQDSELSKRLSNYFLDLFQFNEDGLTFQRKKGIESICEIGPRLKEDLKFYRFDYIAGGLQLFIENFISEWVRNILKKLNLSKIAFSGGLFMNVKLNKKIMELKEVEKLFIFPSCSDESNVFGALYYYYFKTTGKLPRPLNHLYLGGEFSEREILEALHTYQFKEKVEYKKIENIEDTIAELLSKNKIVAHFDGKMEFGARALGNRSILANPQNFRVIRRINKMVKKRDFWMPFAPSFINGERYVINPKRIKMPYMILLFDTKKEKFQKMIAAVHPHDRTCRPQEVDKKTNPRYYRIISKFEKLTGEGVILNTSFNLHGRPIVYSPRDALYVFENSGLNYLVMGNYLIKKTNQNDEN